MIVEFLRRTTGTNAQVGYSQMLHQRVNQYLKRWQLLIKLEQEYYTNHFQVYQQDRTSDEVRW